MLNYSDIHFLLPEIILLVSACAVLVLHLFLEKRVASFCYIMSQLGLVAAFVVLLEYKDLPRLTLFQNHFVLDNLALLIKMAILVIGFFVMQYTRYSIREHDLPIGEYFSLALFAVVGMFVLVSANSLLTTYMGLELMSLPLYALVAIDRLRSHSSEAAMKYFVLGALASGMLLYGMSLIYGTTQNLYHDEIRIVLQTLSKNYDLVMALGVVFIVIGLAFKLGAAPFHMWTPDVYHGAPAAVTLLIATIPKLAVFAMIIRLLVEALPATALYWQDCIAAISLLSIILGNVIAIAQSNIKRLFAYSAIAHMGFMLLGFVAADNNGYSAALFYSIVYAAMSAGGFGLVILLSKLGFEAEKLEDYKGLSVRNPWLAFLMLLLVFSMAGVPPTVGFYAKFSVIAAIVAHGHISMAVVAVLFSVVGAFYYLRLIKLMYFDAPEDPALVEADLGVTTAFSINSLAVLFFGLFPSVLLQLCARVFS